MHDLAAEETRQRRESELREKARGDVRDDLKDCYANLAKKANQMADEREKAGELEEAKRLREVVSHAFAEASQGRFPPWP